MAVTAAEIRAILTLQDQLSGQLSKVQGELHKLGASATASGNAAKSAGPSWASMSTAIAAGTVAANAFMAVAKGVVGVLTSAGSASADFGQSMANIRSIIPDEDFAQFGDQLAKTALRLGKDYPLSAAEAGKSMELLAQKGISAQKIVEGGAESVVKLASATGADLVTATGIAAAAMDTFNVQASDMGKVTNLMTGAMIRGGMSATDFGHAVQSGGAVIALAGGSIEDASIAIAAMAKAGIEGSDAGTSLKTMYMNLQPSTKGATKAMLELGLVTKDGRNAFFDAQGRVKSFEEISRILSNSLEGLTEQQRLQALETMFGSDAIRAAAVAAKLGAGAYGDLGAEIRGVDAGDVAAKRMDSLKASVGQLTGSAETLAITLMGRLGPGLKTVVDTGTELLNGVLDKLDTPEAAAFFANLATNAKSVEDGLYLAGQVISEFGDAIKDVPIIGAPLNAFLQTAGAGLTGLAAIMRGDAKGAAEAFGDAIGQTVGNVQALATKISETVQPAIDKAIEIGTAVKTATDKAGEMGAWQDFVGALQNVADIGASSRDRLGEIADGLGRINDAAGGNGVTMLAGTIKGLALAFDLSTSSAKVAVDGLLSFVAISVNFLGVMANMGRAAVAWARGDVPAMNAAIGDAGKSLGGMIVTASKFGHTLTVEVAEAVDSVAETMGVKTNAAATVASVNMNIAKNVTDEAARQMARSVEANSSEMVRFMEANTTELTGAADTGMANTVAAVETQAPAAVAAVEAMGDGMVSGIEAAAPEMASAAETAASGAVTAVEGQTGAASAAGSAVGGALGSGMAQGILDWVGRVRAAAAQMVAEAIGGGEVEGEIHSPSERTKETGRMLAAGVAEGIKELSPEVQARMRDMIDAAAEYKPVAGEIKRVEAEIAAVRQRGQTDALFRAKEMITIDSEALRLKKEMAVAERSLLPIRQALARASRDVENLSRGSLADRQNVIGMDGKRKEIRLQIIDLERQLIGMDSDSKKAEGIQKQIDKLQDQDRLLSLEAERIQLTNEVSATGARIKREALDDQIRAQEDALAPLRDQIALLGAEQAVWSALEAIIKNATDNEVAERERLIAVFQAEGAPILARINAGLLLIDQLEKEGAISQELADQLRNVAKEAGASTTTTEALGKAGLIAAPGIDAAAKKAEEMAKQAAAIGRASESASDQVSDLADSLGELPSWFTPSGKTVDAIFKPDRRALGGMVSMGTPVIVGEQGPEMFVPNGDGTILPASATAALLDGSSGGSTGRGGGGGATREIHLHMEGAQIYGMSDFESAVQRAVGRGMRRGQFGG